MKSMEARVGIEPTNKGFADLCLTTWLPRLTCCRWPNRGVSFAWSSDPAAASDCHQNLGAAAKEKRLARARRPLGVRLPLDSGRERPDQSPFSPNSNGPDRRVRRADGCEALERETGLEPATSTLARSHSTN